MKNVCARNACLELWTYPLRSCLWHQVLWRSTQTLSEDCQNWVWLCWSPGSWMWSCSSLHQSWMEAQATLQRWAISCQFQARSLLLELLHNDSFIHVKMQNAFRLYEIVYVHQKCYLSSQSLVSMNQLCNGY